MSALASSLPAVVAAVSPVIPYSYYIHVSQPALLTTKGGIG